MTGSHAHDYIGRHRKTDTDQTQQPDDAPVPPGETGLLRRTYELFTHPPLHTHEDN